MKCKHKFSNNRKILGFQRILQLFLEVLLGDLQGTPAWMDVLENSGHEEDTALEELKALNYQAVTQVQS